MEIIFNPSIYAILIITAVAIIAIASVWLKKGKNRIKIISTVIIIIVIALVGFFFLRPTKFVLKDQGFYTDVYFEHQFSWDQVDKALLVDDFMSSDYKPVYRQNGASIGSDRKGYFELANGLTAVLMTQVDGKAIFFKVGEKNYLFAPADFDLFYQSVTRYITVEE